MKSLKFISAFLVLVILLNICSKSLIVANFEWNKDKIAKELCVLRNIPGNCCHGKCHLKKQLQQEEQRENKILINDLTKYEVVNNSTDYHKNQFILPQTGTLIFIYNQKIISQDPLPVFHPPSC